MLFSLRSFNSGLHKKDNASTCGIFHHYGWVQKLCQKTNKAIFLRTLAKGRECFEFAYDVAVKGLSLTGAFVKIRKPESNKKPLQKCLDALVRSPQLRVISNSLIPIWVALKKPRHCDRGWISQHGNHSFTRWLTNLNSSYFTRFKPISTIKTWVDRVTKLVIAFSGSKTKRLSPIGLLTNAFNWNCFKHHLVVAKWVHSTSLTVCATAGLSVSLIEVMITSLRGRL